MEQQTDLNGNDDTKNDLKIIECPRDAMQGLHDFIPTVSKVEYAQTLLSCGFHTLDVGSFVSPKAIPQLKDTADVLESLDMDETVTELLVIVANERGAHDACQQEKVSYLGFPFSISETFLKRNINSSIDDSLRRLERINELAELHDKEVITYLSMGFGNPYGEPWSAEIVTKWCARLIAEFDTSVISLSDTIGTSDPESISYLFGSLIPEFPEIEFGAHLHTTPDSWEEKISMAYAHGCRRFDGAIKGFGGCPMADDELTGNMPTENLLSYFEGKDIATGVNKKAFSSAMQKALDVFPV